MVTALAGLIRRDLRLALRQGSDAVLVLAFFVMAVLLFPFGVGPEPNLLARIAAGVIWSMALLAALLSFDRLFQADHEDGSLDLQALAPLPLSAIVLAKTAAHWLTTGMPLLLVSPLLALVLRLPGEALPMLLLALLLGTPTLSLVTVSADHYDPDVAGALDAWAQRLRAEGTLVDATTVVGDPTQTIAELGRQSQEAQLSRRRR